ncbi:MAG: DUF2805 domain-containing protein [Bacteroidetes bacterium]|nr:DUF2805 domain-containing protein [Bacteroidota bacterium]
MAKTIKNLKDVWEDSTSFDALRLQFGLKNNELVKLILNKNPISLTIKLLSLLSYKTRNLIGQYNVEDIDSVL